jgi:hypothetical protein
LVGIDDVCKTERQSKNVVTRKLKHRPRGPVLVTRKPATQGSR